jgi:hypothetical protein
MLLAIADYAKDDGTGAWPSLATLARKTRMGRRNAIEVIKKLEGAGELIVHDSAGPKGCNLYDIICPSEAQFTTSKAKKKLVNPNAPGLVNPDAPELVNPSSPNPSCNHHESIIKESAEPPARDFLSDALEAHARKATGAGIADPSQDDAAWFEYREAFTDGYKASTGFCLPRASKSAVLALASEAGADPPFWSSVVAAWVRCGWNPKNVDGMIDYYRRHEIPTTAKANGKDKPHANHHNPGRVPGRLQEYSVADPADFDDDLKRRIDAENGF